MQAQVFSIAHGGPGSGCCCYCDPRLVVRVRFEDGTTAQARRFVRSDLGKGFARIEASFGGGKWTKTVLTPRDTVDAALGIDEED